MHALLALCWWACGSPPVETAGPGQGGAPDCTAYAELPSAAAWCRVTAAPVASTIEAARCDEAGAFEEACRIRWVQAHADAPVDTLLAACSTEECRFVALDWQPAPLAEQVPRCEGLPTVAEACVSHAVVRFLAGAPPPDALAAAFEALGRHGARAAEQVGHARSCGLEVDCAVLGALAPACETAANSGVPGGDCGRFRSTFPRHEPPPLGPGAPKPGAAPPPGPARP